MIGSLHIKNVGIIEDITINLNEGFNVFTGETGAGKTLIIDSLQILAGGRFSKEIIRHGEKSSYIEMLVYLGEDEYIISREVNQAGRNICKINGRLTTVNELKTFMKKIIDIHGQRDNQTILEPSSHIKFLDGFIGDKIDEIKKEYIKKYGAITSLTNISKLENYYQLVDVDKDGKNDGDAQEELLRLRLCAA